MYQYLPNQMKKDIPQLLFGDTQINSVCRDYYRDQSFCKGDDGSINLWKLYNLFTGSNKSSYIDGFLPRAANATTFVSEIANALDGKSGNWFLN